jgi:hypothetical protein
MYAFWKDLLFLHQQLARRDELVWRPDALSAPAPARSAPLLASAPRAGQPEKSAAAACA